MLGRPGWSHLPNQSLPCQPTPTAQPRTAAGAGPGHHASTALSPPGLPFPPRSFLLSLLPRQDKQNSSNNQANSPQKGEGSQVSWCPNPLWGGKVTDLVGRLYFPKPATAVLPVRHDLPEPGHFWKDMESISTPLDSGWDLVTKSPTNRT